MTAAAPKKQFPDCHGCGYFRAGPAAACMACAGPKLDEPGPGACPVCSQRMRHDGACPNELCRSSGRRIGAIHALGYHAGPLRQAINSYKYRGARSWSVLFGRLLLAWLDGHMLADRPDLVVVNPSFVGPGGQSFAHTEAVLAEAARQDAAGRWPFDLAALTKTRPTVPSADSLAWSKRVSSDDLRGALAFPDPSRIAGRHVLVYDDICTTGRQLDAVAGFLLDVGGAARVDGIVLARAQWRGQGRGQAKRG
jgi:predicted amidophosphoribosyltransferase